MQRPEWVRCTVTPQAQACPLHPQSGPKICKCERNMLNLTRFFILPAFEFEQENIHGNTNYFCLKEPPGCDYLLSPLEQEKSSLSHPALILQCHWFVLILKWVHRLEALSSIVRISTSNPITIWLDAWKWGGGEQQAAGPLHKQSCWALPWRGPGVPPVCTSAQVSGAGQRRGCRNLGTKTCPSEPPIVPDGSHPSCHFPPQLDGPAASLQDPFFL